MKHWAARFLLLLVTSRLFAAEGNEAIPWRQDQLPNAPYSPEEALTKFTVPEGFKVELVASEPDIVNPIAMTFDDRGRIWITESIEYPRKPAGAGRERARARFQDIMLCSAFPALMAACFILPCPETIGLVAFPMLY